MLHSLVYNSDNSALAICLCCAALLAEQNLVRVAYLIVLYSAWSFSSISVLSVLAVLPAVRIEAATKGNESTFMFLFEVAVVVCVIAAMLAGSLDSLSLWVSLATTDVTRMQRAVFSYVATGNWIEIVDWWCNIWLDMVLIIWNHMLTSPRFSPNNYVPSLGIRWYLDAQMIPEYSAYFEALFAVQPFLGALLLKHHVGKENPSVAMHVAIAILLLFRRDLTVVDVLCGALLLLQHDHIVQRMRHLPLIAAGILVPLVVSPLMFTLWIEKGTGNANYCFFQGLCLWLFCALGISEFWIAAKTPAHS